MNLDAMRGKAGSAAKLMKALANRNRLMILCELHKGERSVGELRRVVRLAQSALSQHLARLRRDGLVRTRRDAQSIYYSVANPAVTAVIGVLYQTYCGKS